MPPNRPKPRTKPERKPRDPTLPGILPPPGSPGVPRRQKPGEPNNPPQPPRKFSSGEATTLNDDIENPDLQSSEYSDA
jgi:hypothetical protein